MKHYITLLIGFALLISCNNQQDNTQVDKTSDGTVMQSELRDTCQCSDLSIDSTGLHSLNGLNFTGVCISYFPETEVKYIEKILLNGLLHGKVTFFDRSGEVLAQELYEKGIEKRSGEIEVLSCDCAELTKKNNSGSEGKSMYFLDEIPFTGTCQKYYPETSQIYMNVSYKKGLLDGTTTYYNKDGSTMYLEKYTSGTLITTVH